MTDAPSTHALASAGYRAVLRAASIIGSASVANVLIGLLRTKFVAVLLGPSGVGLIALYGSITGMIGTLAGMGLSNSGVREIAQAHGQSDQSGLAKVVVALSRTVWFTGAAGLILLVCLADVASVWAFGSGVRASEIRALAIVILLGSLATGQACILQGTRRIGDLAKVSVIGSIASTFIALPCYFFWKERGIVPSLILAAASSVAISWWFARRVQIERPVLDWRETVTTAKSLLRFGAPVMLSSLLTAISTFVIQTILLRKFGAEGLGLYQAAFSLSGALAGFVLVAMGADYYPRLVAVAADRDRVRTEVNAQTEIALLLAAPGLAMTVVFAPLAIAAFYTAEFGDAVEILQWLVFGVLGRVASWPLGFLVLAKGRSGTFLVLEGLANLAHVGLVWTCTEIWLLPGSGVASVLLYILYSAMQYVICSRMIGSIWNSSVRFHVFGFTSTLIGLVLLTESIELEPLRWGVATAGCLLIGGYCAWRLAARSGLSLDSLRTMSIR